MITVQWDEKKNELLQKERGVSFEEVAHIITENGVIDVLPHNNQDKYPNQKLFIVKIRDYIYIVPFVEDKEKIFLKTIIPSRKYKKKY